VPPFRAAQIVGARFAFFVSLAHVKDRLKQVDGVFESGLENRPTFHCLFLEKNKGVSESLRTTYQLQTPILVGKVKDQNACIALPERYIQSVAPERCLGPPAYP
jgi:hypothetical protein